MPQPLLPLVPDGATPICDHISVVKKNDTWTYFAGVLPVFSHPEDDRNSFRMFTAQLVCKGTCRQVDIVKTFGVAPVSVKRAVKQYRKQGSESFYQPRRGRGASVMTDQVIQQAQELLNQGYSRKETAQELKIKLDWDRRREGSRFRQGSEGPEVVAGRWGQGMAQLGAVFFNAE